MKVFENTSAVLLFGKLCDANGYSYEWINGHKPHLIKNGIRIPCNTENFVPIVVPGLSSSSSGSSSTSRTLMKQESRSSSSSSSSSLSPPIVGEIHVREREDATNSDLSPVPVSKSVDDGSGQPEENQANKILKPNKKETMIERGNPCDSEIPEWLQEFRENLVDDEILSQGGSHASSSHEVSLETGSHLSTSMTPSTQEMYHSTSSSSSSSSPTTATSCDSETQRIKLKVILLQCWCQVPMVKR